jgi:predicted MPP superfamily phosphohydrolase
MNEAIFSKLEQRLGRLHAKLRLGIETDHEAQIFGQGINFFHIENWYSVHSVIRIALKLMGLYWRGRRNAEQIQVRHNHISMKTLPSQFDGFSLLHISDLHVEMNEGAMRCLTELLPELTYDVCVLTGDYRGATFGPFDAALEGLARVRSHLKEPVYGVLGNHDTIRMIPGLEEMGIRMLLNECENILRGDQLIYLAGIDDAHYYRVDNIEKAASEIPDNGFSILLSHTPEIYRQAAHAGFDLLLSGHTHGGQICLPGSIPVTLDSVLPRHMGSGPWKHRDMVGYTSAVSEHLSFPSALIAFQKLRCITSNVRYKLPPRRKRNTKPHCWPRRRGKRRAQGRLGKVPGGSRRAARAHNLQPRCRRPSHRARIRRAARADCTKWEWTIRWR